jgi:tight adherence protein C
MVRYIPYLIVLVLFGVLFLRSRGLFQASAAFLLRKFPKMRKMAGQESLSRALMIVCIADLLAILAVWNAVSSDTAAKGYIRRGSYGSVQEERTLTFEIDGSTHSLTVPVDARKMTDAQVRELLQNTADSLKTQVFGDMKLSHTDRDLTFPESLADGLVSASWVTDKPDMIDWDGKLGDDIPESGCLVTLTVTLGCESQTLEKEFSVTAYPKAGTDEEMLQRLALREIRRTNTAEAEDIRLPSAIDGKKVSWSSVDAGQGLTLLLMGIMIAVFYLYSRIRLKELAASKRREDMMTDYPHLINRLVLLNAAGLSMRKSFAQVKCDYEDSLRRGEPERPGYEEIVRACREMEHGVPERQAYLNIGQRTPLPEYKTFSTLLVQNLMKGGDGMARLFRKEADRAFEERKKRAKILGEEAGTKLLMPMILLLLVVMVILMVPALLAFF